MNCFTCGSRTNRTHTFNINYRKVAETLTKKELNLDGSKKYIVCSRCMRRFTKWQNFLATQGLCTFQDGKFPKARGSNHPIVTETFTSSQIGATKPDTFIFICESAFKELKSEAESWKEQRHSRELEQQREQLERIYEKRERVKEATTDRQRVDAFCEGVAAMQQTITAHGKRTSTNEDSSSTSSRATKARTANAQFPPSSPPTATQDDSDGECIVESAKRCGRCKRTIVRGTRAVRCKIYSNRFLHTECTGVKAALDS